MASNEIEGTVCHDCGYQFELATGVAHDQAPVDNDLSVCVNCGAVSIFTVKDGVLGMRKPSREELTRIYQEMPEILNIQRDTHHALNMALRQHKSK